MVNVISHIRKPKQKMVLQSDIQFGIQQSTLKCKCSVCGISEWNDKPLPMFVVIRGRKRINLCSNCVSVVKRAMGKFQKVFKSKKKVDLPTLNFVPHNFW